MTKNIFETGEIIITSFVGRNKKKYLQFNFGSEYHSYEPEELLQTLKEAVKAIEKDLLRFFLKELLK